MDELCDQILSRSAFSGDQDRRVERRDPARLVHGVEEGRATANDRPRRSLAVRHSFVAAIGRNSPLLQRSIDEPRE